MRNLSLLLLAAVVWALLALPTSLAQSDEDFKFIVHPDNPLSALTKSEASSLLLKKRASWEHGVKAEPVDLDGRSPVRQAMSQEIHGRSVSSIKNYWQRQIFAGRGVPPPEVRSDDAVIAYVSSHAGGIGYVSGQARLRDVKEIVVQ